MRLILIASPSAVKHLHFYEQRLVWTLDILLLSGTLFIHVHNETLSIIAGCIDNPDCSPIGTHG